MSINCNGMYDRKTLIKALIKRVNIHLLHSTVYEALISPLALRYWDNMSLAISVSLFICD